MHSDGRARRSVDFRSAWAALLGIQFSVRVLDLALVTVGVSDAVLVLAAAAAIRRQEWRHWLELRKDPVSRWIARFSAVLLTGLLVSRLRLGHWSWWGLINRGLGLPVLLCIYCLFATVAKQKVWFYLRWFVIAGSLLNLPALAAVAVRYGFDRGSVFLFWYSSLRLGGLMHHPNAYGGYLAALLAVQLSALAFGKRIFRRQWIEWVNVAALLLAAAFTISRSAWVTILGGATTVLVLAASGLKTTPRRSRDLVPSAAAAVAALSLLLIAGGGGMAAVMRDGVTAHTTIDSSSIYYPHGSASFTEFLRIARDPAGWGDRLAIDRTALELYAASTSRVVFGLGLGAFEEMSASTRLQTDVTIHNSYLWALVDLGPLGALCLLGIFATSLRRLWTAFRSGAGDGPALAALLAALMTCCTWGLSNDGIFQRQLWFFLGLSVAATVSARRRPESTVTAAEGVE